MENVEVTMGVVGRLLVYGRFVQLPTLNLDHSTEEIRLRHFVAAWFYLATS